MHRIPDRTPAGHPLLSNSLLLPAASGAHSSSTGRYSHDLSWATLGLKQQVAVVSSQSINLCGHESRGLLVSQALRFQQITIQSTDAALSTLPPYRLLQGFDQQPLPCLAACSSAQQMPYAPGSCQTPSIDGNPNSRLQLAAIGFLERPILEFVQGALCHICRARRRQRYACLCHRVAQHHMTLALVAPGDVVLT